MQNLIRIYNVFRAQLVDFRTKQGFLQINSLAYVLLTSFIPFAISCSLLVTIFVGKDSYINAQDIWFSEYFPAMGPTVARYINSTESSAFSLSIFSLLGILVTSYLMIYNLRNSLDAMLNSKFVRDSSLKKHLYTILYFITLVVVWSSLIGLRQIIDTFVNYNFSSTSSKT